MRQLWRRPQPYCRAAIASANTSTSGIAISMLTPVSLHLCDCAVALRVMLALPRQGQPVASFKSGPEVGINAVQHPADAGCNIRCDGLLAPDNFADFLPPAAQRVGQFLPGDASGSVGKRSGTPLIYDRKTLASQ